MRPIHFYAYSATTVFYVAIRKIKVNRLRKQGKFTEMEKEIGDIVSAWSKKILNKVGVTVSIEGNENIPEGSCLFVSNHQGNFDFLAILAYVNKPMGFVAKKEIGEIPYFPKWMKEMHCVFIDRENMRQSVKAINEAADNLKNGHSMIIFPEGTRSRGHNMGEFKRGSMKLAERGGVPIVPITVDGSFKVFEDHHGKKFTKEEIRIIVDKPIYVDNMSRDEKKEISNVVSLIIKNNLEKMVTGD